jgi:hypothetical protein
VYTTIEECETVCLNGELKRVKEAHELLQKFGYSSIRKAVLLVADDNIPRVPELSRRPYHVYGTPPEYICVQDYKRTVSHVVTNENISMKNKMQIFYTNIMNIYDKEQLTIQAYA